jgi:hypothetical protein
MLQQEIAWQAPTGLKPVYTISVVSDMATSLSIENPFADFIRLLTRAVGAF